MKKTLLTAILGLTVAVASVQAQSAIQLYSYGTSSAGSITYAPAGGPVAAGGYTVGVYYALGDIAASVNAMIGGATTQSGANIGSLVGTGLTLATGTGATAPLGHSGWDPGDYGNISSLVLVGVPPTGSPTVTLVLVAYNGANYESSTLRGHSVAFTMTAVSSPGFALLTGNYSGAFSVGVPEPSTFALAGLGLASLLIFRRRK